MNPALVRTMAEVLIDYDVDPFDAMAVVTRLVAVGFTIQEIRHNYDAAAMMVAIRKRNRQTREKKHAS